jgi:cytochrome P450
MAEMLTTLSMLLQKFEFELVHPDYEWRFKPISITLRPQDGMPLRVKQRRETE